MSDRDGPAAYELGRELDVHEALMLCRRATFDPGQFTKRVLYHEDGEVETLERWQARAVLVALSAREPDKRWSSTEPHVTDFEREELKRLGLGRRVRTFTMHLADKPRDILVHLVEHGPATAHQLMDAFEGEGPIYSGGLNLLCEMGLVRGPINEHDQTYNATDEGRRLIEEARAEEAIDGD